jgi:hypothetical protein
MFRSSLAAGTIAALSFSWQAQATLILDTAVTSSFLPITTTTGTYGNDLPGHPNTLYFGQLRATEAGFVDFFYIGNEAGYTNTLMLNDVAVSSSLGLPDNFNAPYYQVGSPLSVGAGSLLDFGFCTDGGSSVGAFGKCAYNDSASSLIAQFNYASLDGYRSIAYRPLTAFDPLSGLTSYASLGASNLWMIFWDDSGAKNDDNHDDYIAVARFRPLAVAEPGTALLLGIGLLGLGWVRRRKGNAAR